ncbi:M28 family peptidase [Polymorphospora sp. NPDC051019]|uniref:M28 family peptidase n=1 Tax=Polymorphospora sp. NPDC051019 TaxID=3155725 RepID=UPI003414CF84
MRWSTPVTAAVAALVVTASVAVTSPAYGRPTVPAAGSGHQLADRLERATRAAGALRHLRAWQSAADANGGTRAADTPGFAASADYLVRRLRLAGYRVTRQPVPYEYYRIDTERAVALTTPPEPLRLLAMTWSPTTPPGGVEAPVRVLPTSRDGVVDPTPGCEPADYAGLPVTGTVVVLPRASCGFVVQEQTAVALGAVAVLFYMPTVRPDNIYRAYLFDPAAISVPVATITQRAAGQLAAQTVGSEVRVRLEITAHRARAVTENILAETVGGRPDRVVMAGAHLDSVTESPGINDNAAAAAALLETAIRLAPHQRAVRNKVRFAWWGAEELIEVGSLHYLAQLDAEQRRRISLYLNYELIASPNFGRFIVDGDDAEHPGVGEKPPPPGSGAVEKVLTGYYGSRGLAYETVDLYSIGSDHWPFADVGIPVGGMDGGTYQAKTAEQAARYGGTAGEMFDRCYHQPCDDLSNLNLAEFDRNCRAVAWVVGRFATDVEDVLAQRHDA